MRAAAFLVVFLLPLATATACHDQARTDSSQTFITVFFKSGTERPMIEWVAAAAQANPLVRAVTVSPGTPTTEGPNELGQVSIPAGAPLTAGLPPGAIEIVPKRDHDAGGIWAFLRGLPRYASVADVVIHHQSPAHTFQLGQ